MGETMMRTLSQMAAPGLAIPRPVKRGMVVLGAHGFGARSAGQRINPQNRSQTWVSWKASKTGFNPSVTPTPSTCRSTKSPQPRDWGTVQLTMGNDVLLSRDMALVGSAPDELLSWIERNLPKIKASGFQQVHFENVAEPIQHRIQTLLNG
jgi:hypothetical protein